MKVCENIGNRIVGSLAAQKPKASDKSNESVPKAAARPRDEYVKGGDEDKSIGLYYIKRGNDGAPEIKFDDPQMTDAKNKESEKAEPESKSPEEKEPEKSEPDKSEPKKKSESCTANTDKVDKEIERLKEKQKQIEQKLRAEDDERKTEQLKKQLDSVTRELSRKDCDSYRRSRTEFS